MTHDATEVLELKSVEVLYEGIIRAVSDISLHVFHGEIVALLGANGAGKTTTLRAAAGLLGAVRGAITYGDVKLRGQSVLKYSPTEFVKQGVVQVVEGRHCFPHLTVLENLLAGTLGKHGLLPFGKRAEIQLDIERVFTRLPRLKALAKARAGFLSGGEQQLLAIGRALMARPSLLLLDEPSMGLAPLMIEEVFSLISELNRNDKLTVLVAEQNVRIALQYAQRGYVLEGGRVVISDSADALSRRDDVKEFYLGFSHEARTSARRVSGIASLTAP